MVRLVCQNCPRSCCDEGEKVDQIRAEKAVSALFKPEEEKTMTFGTYFSETENSNDSTATLEMTSVSEEVDTDTDGEHLYIDDNDHSNGNNNQNHNNGQVKSFI